MSTLTEEKFVGAAKGALSKKTTQRLEKLEARIKNLSINASYLPEDNAERAEFKNNNTSAKLRQQTSLFEGMAIYLSVLAPLVPCTPETDIKKGAIPQHAFPNNDAYQQYYKAEDFYDRISILDAFSKNDTEHTLSSITRSDRDFSTILANVMDRLTTVETRVYSAVNNFYQNNSYWENIAAVDNETKNALPDIAKKLKNAGNARAAKTILEKIIEHKIGTDRARKDAELLLARLDNSTLPIENNEPKHPWS